VQQLLEIPYPTLMNGSRTFSMETLQKWLDAHFPQERSCIVRVAIVNKGPGRYGDERWAIRFYRDEDATLFGLLWQ
jgi:hypothetical protein